MVGVRGGKGQCLVSGGTAGDYKGPENAGSLLRISIPDAERSRITKESESTVYMVGRRM